MVDQHSDRIASHELDTGYPKHPKISRDAVILNAELSWIHEALVVLDYAIFAYLQLHVSTH